MSKIKHNATTISALNIINNINLKMGQKAGKKVKSLNFLGSCNHIHK